MIDTRTRLHDLITMDGYRLKKTAKKKKYLSQFCLDAISVVPCLYLEYWCRSVARPTWKHSLLLGVCISCFMLPWQFAQFTLLTQLLAAFGTYVFGYIRAQKMKALLHGHMVGHLRLHSWIYSLGLISLVVCFSYTASRSL